MKKKFLQYFIILIIIISSALPVSALEKPQIENVGSAYLYNIENDEVLYELNADKVVAPASTAKIMTAILALEYFGEDLSVEVTVPAEAVKNVQGNNIGLDASEVMTAEDLICAMVIGGANDAAQAIAYIVGGDMDTFCDMMNEKAAQIGAVNTYYSNPSGLDEPGMKTTAADTAMIARYAYDVPGYMRIASSVSHVIEATNMNKVRNIYTRNYLLSSRSVSGYYYSRALGMNAGSTYGAGYCIAACAAQEGLSYICVIFEATKDSEEDGGTMWSFKNAITLFDWAFDNFGYIKLVDTSDMICEIGVSYGAGVDHVTLLPSKKLDVFLPLDINAQTDIIKTWSTVSDKVEAPVNEGDVLGSMTLTYNGENIGSVDLIAKNSVSISQAQKVLSAISSVVSKPIFKTVVILLIAFTVVYVFVVAYARGKRNKRR